MNCVLFAKGKSRGIISVRKSGKHVFSSIDFLNSGHSNEMRKKQC